RLNIHNEYLLPLQGLDIPAIQSGKEEIPATTLGEYGAIRLFLDRALVQNPDYSLRPDDITPIVQICQMVEGMPLGIELAATWLDIMTPTEILQDIKHSLDFLTTTWPDRPEKHHSLKAVFDSSWNLLTEQERSALMRLTVLQGSFSRQSAQAVSGAGIDLLQSIKNKSWLKYLPDGSYQIHELLCQFASECLQNDLAAWKETKQRFKDYYVTQLDQHWVKIQGPEQREAFDWINSESNNIRLAWQWLIEAGQVEIAVQHMLPVLYRYSEARAKPFELTQIIDMTLEQLSSSSQDSPSSLLHSILLVAKAGFNEFGSSLSLGFTVGYKFNERLLHQAWQRIGKVEILYKLGLWGMLATFLYGLLADTQEAMRYLQELSVLFRAQGQVWQLGYTLYLLGSVKVLNYKYFTKSIPLPNDAEPILEEALTLFSELGDKSEGGYVLEMIGRLYIYEGKYIEAISKLQEALAYQDDVGEYLLFVSILTSLADSYTRIGDHKSAQLYYHTMKTKLYDEGQFAGAAHALHLESLHSLRFGNIEHALKIRQESIAIYRQIGNELGVGWGLWELGEIYRVLEDLTQAQDCFNQAGHIFKGGLPGRVFLERSEGNLALMAGNFSGAESHFQISANLAQQMNHKWALSYALCRLTLAEAKLGNLLNSTEHLREAIQNAREIDEPDLILNALAVFTELLVLRDQTEEAVELSNWIINHKLTWNETRDQEKSLLSQIYLSPHQLDLCIERSKTLDFERALSFVDQIRSGSED
ncbi:MAG: hypothetical protein WAV05_11245, partial [Anaerolineales bacterium]